MEIVYHVGAYGSGMGQIIRALLRNRDELWKAGVEIPSPGRYRGVFNEAVVALKGGAASPDMQEMLLDAVMHSDHAKRVVLSQPGFIGLPRRAITPNGLYPFAHRRLAGLSNLFPDSSVEFFVAVLHPARQVQELVTMHKGDYSAVMAGVDPFNLRWAPLFRRLVDALPGRSIVGWAQEDLPFTWPEVLRRMAGVPATTPLQDEDAILAELLTAEPLAALKAQIAAQPDLSISARRDLVEEALAAAEPDAIETDIQLPGWSQDLIDELSEIYADDQAEIAALTGVEFIAA